MLALLRSKQALHVHLVGFVSTGLESTHFCLKPQLCFRGAATTRDFDNVPPLVFGNIQCRAQVAGGVVANHGILTNGDFAAIPLVLKNSLSFHPQQILGIEFFVHKRTEAFHFAVFTRSVETLEGVVNMNFPARLFRFLPPVEFGRVGRTGRQQLSLLYRGGRSRHFLSFLNFLGLFFSGFAGFLNRFLLAGTVKFNGYLLIPGKIMAMCLGNFRQFFFQVFFSHG